MTTGDNAGKEDRGVVDEAQASNVGQDAAAPSQQKATHEPGTRVNDGEEGHEPQDSEKIPRDVPGPAGLPTDDPAELHADPSEAGKDPSAKLGRDWPEA
ncbi:hypothetical protein AB6813_00015 [bacterium RCC_150]